MRILFAVLALTLATNATAETKTAKIFQLSAPGLPKSLKGAPEKLTQTLAQSFGAETSIVPIEDAAEIMQCSLTTRACLETIASSAAVKRIIFGRIDHDGYKAVIKLTLFDTDRGESQKSFTVSGETTQELVTSLAEALDPPKREELPTPKPETRSGPTTSTWAMIVGGGIAMGGGLAFLASANTMRAEVARAPTSSRQDLDRLIALEKAGKRRTEIGGGMLAIGGVVATVGIVRLVMQRRAPREDRPVVDVVPEKGGMSVVMTMGWR